MDLVPSVGCRTCAGIPDGAVSARVSDTREVSIVVNDIVEEHGVRRALDINRRTGSGSHVIADLTVLNNRRSIANFDARPGAAHNR